MSKGFGNLMRQAQQMQKKMAVAQGEVEEMTATGEAGQGKVTAEVTGGFSLKNLTIAPDMIDPADPETLQDLIVLAVNDGMAKAKAMKEEAMKKVTGGMNIPGLF